LGTNDEDSSILASEVAVDCLSTGEDSWADWVSENIRVVSNSDLISGKSFTAAILSVVGLNLSNGDLLSEISLPPRVDFLVGVCQGVGSTSDPSALLLSIDGIGGSTISSVWRRAFRSTDWEELVRSGSEGLNFAKCQHTGVSWNGNSEISSLEIASNGLCTGVKTWACWIGKDVGIVSNVNLIISKSFSTAIGSVLDDDRLDGL